MTIFKFFFKIPANLTMFQAVRKCSVNRILGRTALLEVAKKKEEAGDEYFPFTTISKPLFCHALSGQVICFTGFKKEDELVRMALLVAYTYS